MHLPVSVFDSVVTFCEFKKIFQSKVFHLAYLVSDCWRLVWKRNQIISYFFHRRHTAAHNNAQYDISEHVQYTEAGQKRLKGPFTLRFYKR